MPKYEGKRDTLWWLWPEDIVIIGIDTDDGPEHPLWDPRVTLELDPNFVASIASVGVLQPVGIAKEGNRFVCVFGRQRIRACRALNETRVSMDMDREFQVPTVIGPKTMDENMMAKQIVENELRQDDDLRTKLVKLQRYLDHGGTEKTAAMVFGKKRQTIERWVKFMGLAAPLQERVFRGELSVSQALRVAGKSHKSQLQAAKDLQKAKRGRPPGPSRKTLESFVEEAATGTVDKGFIQGVRFAIGKVSAEEAGVQEVMEQIKKAKRRKK